MLDVAIGLSKLGYAPIPMGREKRPLVKWGRFHFSPPGWRELWNEWWPDIWAQATGVAVVTGRPHGLVVVDADDDASWEWALANLPAVRGVRSHRGGHLHFVHPQRGIIGNRSGNRAVTPAPGVRLDVKGLAGLAVAPYSKHPSGAIYEPIGDWTRHVSELPELPAVIVKQAEDKPPPPPSPRRAERMITRPRSAFAHYLAKVGGVPDEGSGSDEAVSRGAAWCKTNVPELTEQDFIEAIRGDQPGFSEAWIATKWRSARGA